MTARMKEAGVKPRGDIVVHAPPRRVLVMGVAAGIILALLLVQLVLVAA